MIRCNTNTVRACRQKSGLTQAELAELIGSRMASRVSRLESGARGPDLPVIVAYEIVFARPARTLLADAYREASRQTHMRAKALKARLEAREPEARQRIDFLEDLIDRTAV